MDKEGVVDLIRKLLALSQSPNENEASLAMAKASELLIKYNIDRATVEASRPAGMKDDESELFNSVVDFEDQQSWNATLLAVIARPNFCRVITCFDGVHILGRKANVRAVEFLYNWIEPQVIRLSLPIKGKLDRKSYCLGMANTIGLRLREQMEGYSANALIIHVNREIETYYKDEYPNAKSGRKQQINYTAYRQGVKDGHNVSMTGANKQTTSGVMSLNSGR